MRGQIFIPAPHAAQLRVSTTPKQRGTHHANNLAQQLPLAAQACFNLGHEVFRQPQVIEGLLEGRCSVLRLAAVAREALLRCAITTASGFGVFFCASFGWRHGTLLTPVWVCGGGSQSKRTWHTYRASVNTASPLRHVLSGLPAFFGQPSVVYMRPHGFAHSHTVCCTPHGPREGGQ